MSREITAAAAVNAAAARALIRALGMAAENQARERRNEAPAYGEHEFNRVIEEEGIGYNNVTKTLRGE